MDLTIVSDHVTLYVSAKRIVTDTHKHIIPVRCIAHHINLINLIITIYIYYADHLKHCQE